MGVKFSKLVLIRTFFVLLSTMHASESAKKHQVIPQFSRVVCRVYNETIVESFNCSLTTHDITKERVLNVEFKLTQPLTDVKLKNKFLVNRSGTITKFLDIEMDICDALSERFDFYLFRMVLDEVHRISNLPLQCPLYKNRLYYIRNFTINAKYFPQFLPNLEWSSYQNYSVDDRKLFGMDVFGVVMRKKYSSRK